MAGAQNTREEHTKGGPREGAQRKKLSGPKSILQLGGAEEGGR